MCFCYVFFLEMFIVCVQGPYWWLEAVSLVVHIGSNATGCKRICWNNSVFVLVFGKDVGAPNNDIWGLVSSGVLMAMTMKTQILWTFGKQHKFSSLYSKPVFSLRESIRFAWYVSTFAWFAFCFSVVIKYFLVVFRLSQILN